LGIARSGAGVRRSGALVAGSAGRSGGRAPRRGGSGGGAWRVRLLAGPCGGRLTAVTAWQLWLAVRAQGRAEVAGNGVVHGSSVASILRRVGGNHAAAEV
jgi:hypothetical protein